MYLSRLLLDEKRRETMHALSCPQIIHGAVECSFDGDRDRNLWRIDRLGGNCYLLILSRQAPKLDHIAKQFGFMEPKPLWDVREYDRFLNNIEDGQTWHFRLRANPVRSSSIKGERGKVHAHVTYEQQKEWLLSRAKNLGFNLDSERFDVVDTAWLNFIKGSARKNNVTIRTSTFEGVLTVSSAELFKQTLHNGVGRAKAYGCGLLTIARI